MKTVSVSALRSQLSALLAQVDRGEVVAIARRGQVVARLVPGSGVAADVFRPFWSERDVELIAPSDSLV